MEFKTLEQEEKFIIDFMVSQEWQFLKEMIEGRQRVIMGELGNPRTSTDGRAMLNGRLIETQFFLQVPQQMANYAKVNRELRGKQEDLKSETSQKLMHPDVITH